MATGRQLELLRRITFTFAATEALVAAFVIGFVSPDQTAAQLVVAGQNMRWLLERFSAFVHTYVPEGEDRGALLDWISRIEKVQLRRNRVVHSWWSNPEVEGDPLKAMKLTTTKKGLKAWEFERVSDQEVSAIAEELAVVNPEFGEMISHAQAAGPRWHLELA